MERTKKYVKTFVTIGILAGVLFGLVMSRKMGFLNGLLAGIQFGSICAVLMASVLIPLDYFMTRKLPAKALDVNQVREIQVDGALDETFQKCVDLLKRCKTIKSVSPSKKEDFLISARTRASIVSFGEEITLHFQELTKGIIKIQISSKPAVPFTLLDYGKNFRNVELIREKIESISTLS